MTNEDKELERLAKAATPGKRTYDREGQIVWGPNGERIADIRGVGAGLPVYANGHFIAALDPQTVLALLERLRGLEAMHERDVELIADLMRAAELIADLMRAVANCQAKLAERKGTVRLTLEQAREIEFVGPYSQCPACGESIHHAENHPRKPECWFAAAIREAAE